MSKPGKSLRNICKKLGVRLTVKRGKKRVYKSVKVLKAQCKRKTGKKKKRKKVKRRRKFGAHIVSKDRGISKDVEHHIASYLGPDPQDVAQHRRDVYDQMRVHFEPPPRLQRVPQYFVGDDGGFHGFENE